MFKKYIEVQSKNLVKQLTYVNLKQLIYILQGVTVFVDHKNSKLALLVHFTVINLRRVTCSFL